MTTPRTTRRIRSTVPAALLCLAALAGCSSAPDAPDGPDTSSATTGTPSASRGAKKGTGTSPAKRPSTHPPVAYTPAAPDRTTRSKSGHLVNTCVPKSLRDKATTLTTGDGVHLSALELGEGPNGVLLGHERGYNICSFLDIGRKLADRGYHVVIPEYRAHGASEAGSGPTGADRDARAALAELKRLGAERVFLGGASCGGTTTAVAGAEGDLPVAGLLILSSPAECDGDGVAAVKKIDAPSLFVVSPGDMDGAVEREVRTLHAASAAAEKKLVIDKSDRHGTDMINQEGARGARLRDQIVAFVESAYAKAR